MPEDPVCFNRSVVGFVNRSDQFLTKGSRNFEERQYAGYYHIRLKIVQQPLVAAALNKWGNKVPQKKIGDVVFDEEVWVIGTVYKESELKPSILKEVAEAMEDMQIDEQPVLPRYAQESDTLVLEDNHQRIVLAGDTKADKLCTGCVIAILGKEDDRGFFMVKDIAITGMPPQPEWPRISIDSYVAFVSGLGCRPKDPASMFPVEQFIQRITGQTGSDEQIEKMSKVGALIIAGGIIAVEEQNRIDRSQKTLFTTRNVKATTLELMEAADAIIMQLTACMDVYLMPGANDPGSYLMPQQPLHPCILPNSYRSTGLHLVTNPLKADFNGVRFLGTSGQNVTDFYRNTLVDDPLEIMEQMFQLRHVCPSAPDTVDCYPDLETDPFVLEETPHVFFAGNQEKAVNRVMKGPQGQKAVLLTVPDFMTNPTISLLNLRTLEVESIRFENMLCRKKGE